MDRDFVDFSPGMRVKMLRLFLGFSREDFCSKYSMNINTLVSIELDRLKISEKQLNKIISAFKSEHIDVCPMWLKTGQGTVPGRMSSFFEKSSRSFLEEWAGFFSENPNSIMTCLISRDMEPIYKKGDLVGGMWNDNIEELMDRPCIAQVGQKLAVGFLRRAASDQRKEGEIFLDFLLSDPLFLEGTSCRLAEINWHIQAKCHHIPYMTTENQKEKTLQDLYYNTSSNA